ncbi:MAG: SoxR reducing system RseC family protein [Cyclobacteriaceae bacterium]
MQNTNQVIAHQGIVKDLGKGMVRVRLVNVSACAGCHAKAACGVSDVDNKEIEILADDKLFKAGDQVKVHLEESLGFKALALGYLLPFVLLFAVLLISFQLTANELFSGLLALATLLPYYLILSLYKNRLKTTFSFTMYHDNQNIQ